MPKHQFHNLFDHSNHIAMPNQISELHLRQYQSHYANAVIHLLTGKHDHLKQSQRLVHIL